MLGQVIGSYRVVSELGQGGMGRVYRAEHVQLGRPAALKVLLPQFSNDPGIVQRFFNEARAASAIDHPGIVEIYDYGTHSDGRAYIVMALLKGQSLDHRLMHPVAPLEAASILAQVAGALAAAHARGIVHRDLKPDNIFLVPNELLPGGIQIKLLDFGIAKLADDGGSGFKTQTGVMIGTPAYMSPEQCMGRADLDHRTDLYSLGCILFHMLCGRPPFLSDQGTGVMIAAHLRDPAPHPRTLAPHVPEALAAITLRLLEKDPAARYQSALELRSALVAAGAIAPSTLPGSGGGAGAGAGARAGSGSVGFAATSVGFGTDRGAGPSTGAPADAYGATLASPSVPGHHSGPGAYAATAAVAAPMPSPTTASGAAAEVVPHRGGHSHYAPDPHHGAGPRRKGGRGAWAAVGVLLVALGGTGAVVAISRSGGGDGGGGGSAAGAAIAGQQPALPTTTPIPPEPTPPTPPAPPSPPMQTGEPPCPTGQIRDDDTRGHCCWPGQAWSSAKNRCLGAPSCPPGMRAKGATCVPVPADTDATATSDPLKPSPHPGRVAAPALQLGATSFAPGASIDIAFSAPIDAPAGRRAWLAIAPTGSSPSTYRNWSYVDDGAHGLSLYVPNKPGSYEVRLHTDYPAKSYNVVRSVRFTVAALAEAPLTAETPRAEQRFTLAETTVRPDGTAFLRFPTPLHAARGEQFWATVVQRGEPDSAWGKYLYVPPGARTLSLPVPSARGDYEVRLHANYPKKSTNVVHRAAIRVAD